MALGYGVAQYFFGLSFIKNDNLELLSGSVSECQTQLATCKSGQNEMAESYQNFFSGEKANYEKTIERLNQEIKKLSPESTSNDVLVKAYENDNLKVLKIIDDQKFGYYVVVASARPEYSCGGMYSDSPCYFFLEYKNWAGQSIKPKFLTSRKPEGLDLVPSNIDTKFIDADNVQFKAVFGDSDVYHEERYNLNLKNNKISKVK